MSFDHAHYVANVRWKAAEREALQWLGKREKIGLTPLIELIPRNFRTKDGNDRPIRDCLRRIASDIDTFWGPSPAFIDLAYIAAAQIRGADDDPHIFELLAEESRRTFPLLPRESSLIPVTGLSRSDDYQSAVMSIIEEDQTGVCFRVTSDDLADSNATTNFESVLSRLKVDVPDADLVVDLQYLNNVTPNLQDLIAAIPDLSKWRTFTLLAGAFPEDLQGIERDSVGTLTRDEWFYWREQVQLLKKGMRWPTFGDYTIQHPIFKEPADGCNPSASIRYTFDDYWVIMRGHGLTHCGSLGNAQYTAEAKLLCDMDEFCRPQFSKGDRYIYDLRSQQEPKRTGNSSHMDSRGNQPPHGLRRAADRCLRQNSLAAYRLIRTSTLRYGYPTHGRIRLFCCCARSPISSRLHCRAKKGTATWEADAAQWFRERQQVLWVKASPPTHLPCRNLVPRS